MVRARQGRQAKGVGGRGGTLERRPTECLLGSPAAPATCCMAARLQPPASCLQAVTTAATTGSCA